MCAMLSECVCVYESLTDIKAAVLTEGFMSEVRKVWSKKQAGC